MRIGLPGGISPLQRNNEIYDAKVALNKYSVGSVIWYLSEARQVGECQKLMHVYKGPYLIVKKYSEINFLLQLDKKGKTRVTHRNKLKPYEGDDPPSWLRKAKRKLMSSPNLQRQ